MYYLAKVLRRTESTVDVPVVWLAVLCDQHPMKVNAINYFILYSFQHTWSPVGVALELNELGDKSPNANVGHWVRCDAMMGKGAKQSSLEA